MRSRSRGVRGRSPVPRLRAGLRAAGRMIRVAGARQRERLGGALLEPHLDRKPLLPHLGEAEPIRPIARDDHEVDPSGKKLRAEAEALAAQALDPVSPDRAPDPPRHDDAEASRGRRTGRVALGGHEQREVRGPEAAARALRADELRMSPQPAVAPEPESHYFLYRVGTRRLRPLRRRFWSTLRPPRVDMRARKPCVRALRMLCG